MGLLGALNTAVSGLNVNQQNLNTLSQNISNANTPGYSSEKANQQAMFLAGMGAGASIASITRSVNLYLNGQVNAQTSINTAASTTTDYYTQIQNLLGQPGSTNSIDQGISNLFTALQNLANSPTASSQTSVVNSANATAAQIAGLASALQNLRLQSDSDINSAVINVNTDLNNLAKINSAIDHAAAVGQNTAGLLDSRDVAMTDLAQYMDVKSVFNENGSVSINTTNGITLLTDNTSAQLSYTPISSVSTLINNGTITPINVTALDMNGKPLGLPIELVSGGTSSSVTSTLISGKIQSLLTMRDSTIPNILTQLDQLTGNLRDSINAINNAGTSFPPPSSYTGTTALRGSSVSQYTGSVMIAAVTTDGSPIASPYADEPNGVQPLTIDLSKLNTGSGAGNVSVDGLINSINQYYGTPQNKLEIGNINNVQLAVASANVPDIGATVSFGFNLNNISNNSAAFYVGGITVTDSNGNPVASSAAGTVTTTQPSVSVATIGTTAGSDTVQLNTTGINTLANGDVIYLNPPQPSSGTTNGISNSQLGGYFTVNNVTNNSFQITLASGAGAAATLGTTAVPGVTALRKYDTVASGDTTNTASNGVITAQLNANTNSPYYTISANVATINSNGQVVNSVVSYRMFNNQTNSMNNAIGATSATGSGTIIQPATSQPLVTATLVDANGNPLQKLNGAYGNQTGYLKITAGNGKAVAINELNSRQIGEVTGSTVAAGTNQGLSQYFGLNNLFNPNSSVAGDTLVNSALNFSVENRLISNPSLISTGQLTLGSQPSGSASLPNFTYILAAGDNSISQRLAGLATHIMGFDTAGGLPPTSTTLSQYAGQIIAATSTNSTNATNLKSNSQALLDGFTKSAQTVSGVNLDQQLANTVIYQNAYSASARVISIVGTMFDTLINSIK